MSVEKDMKRILIISPMPPLIGGVSVSSKRLYDNLVRDGYDVSYYNLKFKNVRFNNSLGIIVRFAFIPLYILFHRKYDVIHCHISGIYRKLYMGLFKSLFKGARLIMTIHGDISSLIASRMGVYALSKADRIICVQPGDSQKTPLSIRNKCVDIPAFLVPLEINTNSIPVSVLDFVQKKDLPLIVFNGAVVLSKQFYDLYGFQDVVDLYKKLQRENIACKLLIIVNNDILNSEQSEFVDSLRSVTSTDLNVLWVVHEKFELMPIFKYARVYVRPTKTDGDSLSVREALAMGCAVVTSDKAKRPSGALVYHTAEEFFGMTKDVLLNGAELSNKVKSETFYNQIKEQYELG